MFGTVLKLFKVGGIFSFFDNKSPKISYLIYSIIIIVHPLQLFVLEALELKNTVRVYEEILDQLIFFPVHLVTIVKSFVLCWNYRKVNRIMEDIHYEYDFLTSFGGKFKEDIEMGVKKIGMVSMGWVGLTLMMTLITTGTPLFHIVNLNEEDFLNGDVECRKMLLLYSVIPFPTTTKWFCVYAYIFELTAAVIYLIHILACDTFFVILLLHLNIDVKVLRDIFATIKSRCLKTLNLPTDYDLFHDELNPELENLINLDMKELTKSLQRLLRISSDIESIFQHIALAQVIFSLFNLMCCLFMASNVESFSTAFFIQLQVYFALVMQLSIYCIFAHNTSMAFSGIPFAIYRNEWFSGSKSLKSMMIINILRMNKPVVFTAAKFVQLSLPLLVRILRMSYSFYTVLRK